MKKTVEQFTFRVFRMEKGDTLPFDPRIEIVLDHWSSDSNSPPAVSPHLMSDREIDLHIQQLKDDLDAVGQKAKAALRSAQTATKELFRGKKSD